MEKTENRHLIYEKIHMTLRQRIEASDLGPGAVLYESAVARAFGVSRAPVQKAFELLADEGLIEPAERRGYVVRPRDTDHVNAGQASTRQRTSADHLAMIAGTFRSSRPVATWQRIYGEVEKELAARAVFGRARVNEHEMARSFSVSRTVAHDALIRLHNLGILDKDRQSRWFVVPLTHERIRNLYEVRRLLEPAALLGAAGLLGENELLAARDRIDLALARYPNLTVDELHDLETDLHERWIGRCPNIELVTLLRPTQLQLISNKHMLGAAVRLPDREPFLNEHRAVIDALLDDNPEAASRALVNHLLLAEDNVHARADALRTSPPPPLPPYLSEG